MKIYELEAKHTARKEFYGKALVIDHEDGDYDLLSYGVLVSRCVDGTVTHIRKKTQTTTRHQNEFAKQFDKALQKTT